MIESARCNMESLGKCCCTCRYNGWISKHPSNQTKEYRGNLSDRVVYACMVFVAMPDGGNPGVVLKERECGICEEWVERK